VLKFNFKCCSTIEKVPYIGLRSSTS